MVKLRKLINHAKIVSSNNLCSTIPSVTTNSLVFDLSIYLSYLKCVTEFKRMPPNKLLTLKPDQTANACVSVQLQNKILSKIFYQELKYADHELIESNLSKIADISIISTDQVEINFAVSCFTQLNEFKLDFFQKNDNIFKVTKSSFLTVDWPWNPIIDIFQQNKVDDELSAHDLNVFNESLSIVSKENTFLEKISHEIIFNRLLCTALSGSNIFFNSKLANSLISTLQILKIQKITPETKNLFKQLLNHFEASSYGNIKFSKFVLIPVLSEDFEPSSKKTPVFVELHTALFSENLNSAHLAAKSTDFKLGNDVEKMIKPTNSPATPVIARNFAHFCATSGNLSSDLFVLAVRYLKEFFSFCEKHILFEVESRSLKRDLERIGHLKNLLWS